MTATTRTCGNAECSPRPAPGRPNACSFSALSATFNTAPSIARSRYPTSNPSDTRSVTRRDDTGFSIQNKTCPQHMPPNTCPQHVSLEGIAANPRWAVAQPSARGLGRPFGECRTPGITHPDSQLSTLRTRVSSCVLQSTRAGVAYIAQGVMWLLCSLTRCLSAFWVPDRRCA